MTDWVTWPIFTLQLLTFLCFALTKHTRLFSLNIKVYIIALVLIANLFILLSMYHDSSSVLGLYF